MWYNVDMQEANIPTGAIFGAYRIIRQLGVGGMGAVYEVEHIRLGVRYALKVYTLCGDDSDLFRKRFSAEGKILARLNHPNLIRVIDLDVDLKTGLLYYVMDLVLYKDGESRTLSDLEPGGADEEHLLDWFRQLTSALGYIHERGIVHRDIKLNNILLAPGRRVILSDFGISRVFSENLRTDVGVSRTMTTNTTGALVVGTEGYMAPEVLRGEPATPAADVYALGVVFFKLLTGVWYDKDLEPRSQPTATGSTDAVKLLSNFEYGWKDILPRMLASDPTKRPINLTALADQLNGSSSAPRDDAPRHFRKRRFGRKALFAACIVLILAVLATAVWTWTNGASAVNDEDDLAAEAFAIPETVK